MSAAAPQPDGKLAAALAWSARGFRVFPLQENGKLPAFGGTDWTAIATTDAATITAWWRDPLTGIERDYNIGVDTTGLLGIDIDNKNGKNGQANYEALGGRFDTLTVRTPTGGYHLYYDPRGEHFAGTVGERRGVADGVDVRAYHNYLVAPGSTIDGVAYEVLFDAPIVPVPEAIRPKLRPAVTERRTAAISETDTEAAIQFAREYLRQAAPAIEGEFGDNRTYWTACEVRDRGVSQETALALMLEEWNDRCEPPWDPSELRTKVESAYRTSQRGEGEKAPEASFAGVHIEQPAHPVVPPAQSGSEDAEGIEAALVEQFVARHAGDLRYVEAEGGWRGWDGQRWRRDASSLARSAAFHLCRQAARDEENPSRRNAVGSERMRGAVERLSRDVRRMRADIDDFDAGDWLLNTPGGVVDLKNGEIRPHDPALLMGKMTSVAPSDAEPRRWLEVLHRICGGDADLVTYLQHLAGYALTGDTSEQSLHFLVGPGGSGKGTYLNSLVDLMGDYATTPDSSLFLANKRDGHPTSLARLAGKRLIVAQEIPEDSVWNEALLKSLSGGDRQTARFMRQDEFSFTPKGKVLIAANKAPAFKSVDAAIERRVRVVPFRVRIPAAEADKDLRRKLLEAEGPAILGWMIRGCVEAHGRGGLCAPETVRAATADYLASENSHAEWMERCCVVGPDEHDLTVALYSSWVTWCTQAREAPGTKKSFAQTLQSFGFERWREGGTGARGFAGLRLKTAFDGAVTFTDAEGSNVVPIGRNAPRG